MNVKLLLVLLLAFCLSSAVYAQLPKQFVAPDFTLTDMNGVSHNLYDYLDNDVTVIMDMWATWCGPCIGSIPGLEKIWEDHGFTPTGDSTIMILSLESDVNTSNEAATVAQYGIATPVFDNAHTILSSYPIAAYPTFFVVYPDRNVYERVGGIGNDPQPLYDLGSPCMPLANKATDLSTNATWYQGEPTFCTGGTVNPGFWVKNMGTSAVTSFNVEVKMNGNTIGNVPWTGSLAQWDGTYVSLNAFSNLQNTLDLDFVVSMPNGMMDENTLDNSIDVSAELATQVPQQNMVVVVDADAYGEETSWTITNSSGVVVAQGGQAGGYPSSQVTNVPVTLPGIDCYDFKVFDSFGDGLFGNASVELRTLQNNVIARVAGDFGDDDNDLFETYDNTSIDEGDFINELNVFPNPFSGSAQIMLDLVNMSPVSMELVDMKGRTVKTYDFGQQTAGYNELEIDATGISSGMYFLTVQVGELTTVRKVTIK